MTESTQSIADYLSSRRSVIVDPSGHIRSAVSRVLIQLGCRPENILSLKTVKDARHALIENQSSIVISESGLGSESGLALIHCLEEVHPDPLERVFFIVSKDAEDSSIAEAVEGEIDGYIVKPFSNDQLTRSLTGVLQSKVAPSPFMKLISAARKAILGEDWELALKALEGAEKVNPSSSIPHYYRGRVFLRQNLLEEAERSFSRGLELKPLHYRCLSGQLDIELARENIVEAYNLLVRISEFFPLTYNHLKELFRLAMDTQAYDRLLEFYEQYVEQPKRSPDLEALVAAAMNQSGVYYTQQKDPTKAVTSFKKAAATSGRSKELLLTGIQALFESAYLQEAKELLAMTLPEDQVSPEYQVWHYRLSKDDQEPDKQRSQLQQLIQKGIASPDLFEDAIEDLIQQKRQGAAESMTYKAMEEHPDLRAHWLEILKKIEMISS